MEQQASSSNVPATNSYAQSAPHPSNNQTTEPSRQAANGFDKRLPWPLHGRRFRPIVRFEDLSLGDRVSLCLEILILTILIIVFAIALLSGIGAAQHVIGNIILRETKHDMYLTDIAAAKVGAIGGPITFIVLGVVFIPLKAWLHSKHWGLGLAIGVVLSTGLGSVSGIVGYVILNKCPVAIVGSDTRSTDIAHMACAGSVGGVVLGPALNLMLLAIMYSASHVLLSDQGYQDLEKGKGRAYGEGNEPPTVRHVSQLATQPTVPSTIPGQPPTMPHVTSPPIHPPATLSVPTPMTQVPLTPAVQPPPPAGASPGGKWVMTWDQGPAPGTPQG